MWFVTQQVTESSSSVISRAVNLRTGELELIVAKDFHSLYTTVKYDKSARCDRWKQFLNEIFPNGPEVITFL